MEKHTFYMRLDSQSKEQREKTTELLKALEKSYGVSFQVVLRVETDKDFLVPILERLGEGEQGMLKGQTDAKVDALPKLDEDEDVQYKVCPVCGKLYAGRAQFCSTVCYNRDWRARNKPVKKSRKGALPNQAKIDENRNEEEARIDAVVAKAKMTAPSANMEHRIREGGAILGRKL